MEPQRITHYSGPTRIVHWLTAILVLTAFIYGPEGSEEHIYSGALDFDRQLHETLGICVLALAVFRLLWRAIDKRPEPPPVARWMKVAAGIVQIALYIFLFALPLTAIAGAWLEGRALSFLGGIALRPPLAESHALGAKIAEIHTWLGNVILLLAGIHAGAGLFHHYILKDGILKSMLPGRNA